MSRAGAMRHALNRARQHHGLHLTAYDYDCALAQLADDLPGRYVADAQGRRVVARVTLRGRGLRVIYDPADHVIVTILRPERTQMTLTPEFLDEFNALQAAGWHIKLSSRLKDDQPEYTIRLYKEDRLHGGTRVTRPDPLEALRGALRSAQTLRSQASRGYAVTKRAIASASARDSENGSGRD